MPDRLRHGGEKATVAATSRHAAAAEILKRWRFNVMDLTFVVSAFAFCVHAKVLARVCSRPCPRQTERTPPVSFLNFCSYLALTFLSEITQKADSRHS